MDTGLVVKQKFTYRELYNEWVVTYQKRVRPSTFQATATYFKKHILPAFGDYYIDTITIQDCQAQVNRQTTANIYTHVTNNKKDNTIDKFDKLMSKKVKRIVKNKNQKIKKPRNR